MADIGDGDDVEYSGPPCKKRVTIELEDEENVEENETEKNAILKSIVGCRDVSEFEFVAKLGDGTYGIVSKVRDKVSKKEYAMKGIKMEESKDGFPLQSLREIKTLQSCRHPNVVSLEEVVVGNAGMNVYLLMEYVENDVYTLMEAREKPFTVSEAKCLLQQLLAGVMHLHENWVVHRDIKPANLLMSNQGVLKLADFGLAREFGSPLGRMTPGVVTLRYRSPEVLLGGAYSTALDIWSVGCIFAEFLTKQSLFAGHNELEQLDKIFAILGSPSERIWPGFSNLPALKSFTFREQPFSTLRKTLPMLSELGFQLLKSMFVYDPSKRISAEAALNHPYFLEGPLPMDPSLMPTHRPKVDGKINKGHLSTILQSSTSTHPS
jgi:cell division cycle 2-like protein